VTVLATALTLEAPVIGAIIGAIVVILGGMYGLMRLDNNRVIRVHHLELELAIRNHRDTCPGAEPIVQHVTQSDSQRFLAEFSDRK